MDESQWQLVAEERRSLAGMLEQIPDSQWQTRSLCEEWTVHHVLAHVVMPAYGDPGVGDVISKLLKARGRLWTAARDLVVESHYASLSPQQLLAMLRESVDSRAKPSLVIEENILPDLVVHGQDMAVPLGIDRPVPDAAAAIALDRLWKGWAFSPARRRLKGLTLVADGARGTVWRAGEGPEVHGESSAMALLITGRSSAAVQRVHGPGTEHLIARLRPQSA